MSTSEKEVFNSLLKTQTVLENRYTNYIIILYKELNNNLETLTRVIHAGTLEKVINKSMFTFLRNLLKEAITLAYCIPQLANNNNYINLTQTAKLERFKVARINRVFIYRTLKKYNIYYTTVLGE